MRLFGRAKHPSGSISKAVVNKSTTVLTKETPRTKAAGRRNALIASPSNGIARRSKIGLYRFLTNEIPVVQACVSTWVRMSAAPGNFTVDAGYPPKLRERALSTLAGLADRLSTEPQGGVGSLVSFLTELFQGLYRDGTFAGFIRLSEDGFAVDGFQPVDASALRHENSERGRRLLLEQDARTLILSSPDFYCLSLNADSSHPLGSSILQTIPFVAYIQQQLVDDMRRSSHNAGYHRLHVKVTPPERVSGESDQAYIERINSYFDSTVSMIKSCAIDENPVTWDNVAINHIGPENVRAVTNSWFTNHRAMVEEICAGTNLAPFMLGYSYGATSTWSAFKFDLVMRQVRSVQAEVSAFLKWIGNIELALAGIPASCDFIFDNTYAYQATDASTVRAREVDGLLKLFEAGLIDESTARQKAQQLLL